MTLNKRRFWFRRLEKFKSVLSDTEFLDGQLIFLEAVIGKADCSTSLNYQVNRRVLRRKEQLSLFDLEKHSDLLRLDSLPRTSLDHNSVIVCLRCGFSPEGQKEVQGREGPTSIRAKSQDISRQLASILHHGLVFKITETVWQLLHLLDLDPHRWSTHNIEEFLVIYCWFEENFDFTSDPDLKVGRISNEIVLQSPSQLDRVICRRDHI